LGNARVRGGGPAISTSPARRFQPEIERRSVIAWSFVLLTQSAVSQAASLLALRSRQQPGGLHLASPKRETMPGAAAKIG
jgi:hypothetical protein